MILRQGSAGTSATLSDRWEAEEGEKDGGWERNREQGEKEIRYAEIQASNLRVSMAVLMAIFDTPQLVKHTK